MDSLFLRALRCEPTERAPVWLMRQAGRYMPEYRALKERYSFLDLCRNSELATEVTLMPIKQFEPDAAIMFADILLILETLGFSLRFGQDQGPLIDTQNLLEDPFKLNLTPVQEHLSYIPQTIRNLKKELKVPLIGFCGAPFTLATYILEGRSSQHFTETKKWFYHKPETFHHLLELLTTQTIEYLKMQIEAGVDALQIFDSWMGHFAYSDLQSFTFPYLKTIVEALKPFNIPIILFGKGISALYEDFAALNPQGIGIDHLGNLPRIASQIPKHIAVQGNLEPDLLTAPLPLLKKEVLSLCTSMKDRPGFIFNLGHGIKPTATPDAVRLLIDTVKESAFALNEL